MGSLEAGFVGLLAGMKFGIDVDGDVQRAEMLLDEREDFLPIESADACGEPRESEAGKAFCFGKFVKRTQCVVHMSDGGFSGPRTMIVRGFLGHEVDDTHTAHTAPHPDVANGGMGSVAVVAKVFVERGPLFAQSVCKTLVEGIVGSDPMSDGLCFGFEDIAANFVNHRVIPF